MKLKIIIITLMLFVALNSCKKSSEYFIGKNNGTFESYDGDLKKTESGKWTYQLDGKRLFIDGEGETGDSQWNLTMKNDTLIFHSKSDNLYLIAKKVK